MSTPFRSSSSALIGALALAGCSAHDQAVDPRTQPPLVRVATVSSALTGGQDFTGIVTARVQSDLGFRVPGKVVERLVDAGQVVRQGQPLMRIDRTDFALATTASNQTVEAARARALQTAADEKRYRDLVSAGAVSASAYDQIKASADASRAQLAAAEAEAGVARNSAGYSVLVADADGVVMQTLAEPGQVVAAGQTVVRLAHAGPREATVSLPETVRPALSSSARATIYGTDGAGAAVLRQLSDAADPQTRTFEAKYVLQGAAAGAPLGATVTVSLPDARPTAGQQIPLAALYDSGQGPGVWLVDPKTSAVSWRPVKVSSLGEESAVVTGELAAGERFVSLGAHLLHAGEVVRISPAGAAQ
jgi:RND family efflux transporter MFP subunit